MTVLKGEGTHDILYGSTSINLGTRSNPAYLARPDVGGLFPTVIVAHDRPGVASWLKDLARKFARHGLSVVVPDLYRGAPRPSWREERPLPPWPGPDQVYRSLIDAYRFAESEDTPWASGDRIVVIGIGEGGEAAIRFAVEVPDAAGLILIGAALDESTVPVPILGLYGAEDPALEATLRVPHMELVTYGGVKSRFLDDNSDDFDRPASLDALDRIVAFVEGVAGRGG